VRPRPTKKEWNEQFPEWLSQFEGAVDSALTMNNVKSCFSHSGIYPINSTVVTHSLPTTYPSHLIPQRQSKMLDISNKVITSPEFLNLWNVDEEQKRKEKGKKKGEDVDNIEKDVEEGGDFESESAHVEGNSVNYLYSCMLIDSCYCYCC
jgi:hypothetical protein